MDADGDRLILMSWFTGELAIWNPETQSSEYSTYFNGPVDSQRFQDDLIVTELFTGNVVRASGHDLENRETIATSFGPTGLAASDDDLYVSDSILGTIFQIIEDGEVLNPPLPVATGFIRPEGIALRPGGNRLAVIEAGMDSLKEVHLKSGEIKTIASNLGFYDPLPGLPAFDIYLNNVTIDNTGAMYINADEANVIYKMRFSRNDEDAKD
jgi:sugar lactone lactonase YvrE